MNRLVEAHNAQERYQPNEQVKSALGNVELVAFVGGIAVGKNFLMSQVEGHVVGTLTTRPPRATDDPSKYRYVSHDEFLDLIDSRELVQYGTATHNGIPTELYGSEISDYSTRDPNLSDIWASSFQSLENKGFKSIRSIGVLTPRTQWHSQLMFRITDAMPVDVALSRLDEARHSTRWVYARHAARIANHLLIINDASKPVSVNSGKSETIETIQDFIDGKPYQLVDDDLAIHTHQDMLKIIRDVLGKLG